MRVSAYERAEPPACPPPRAVCSEAVDVTHPSVRVGDYQASSELLRAMASPIRLAVLAELDCGARCVHELIDRVGLPQTLISQHLRVLREAGIVCAERRGREVVYTLSDTRAASICRAVLENSAPAE